MNVGLCALGTFTPFFFNAENGSCSRFVGTRTHIYFSGYTCIRVDSNNNFSALLLHGSQPIRDSMHPLECIKELFIGRLYLDAALGSY